jgi:hypothetical protein
MMAPPKINSVQAARNKKLKFIFPNNKGKGSSPENPKLTNIG